jgi:formate-dependent nitrite reductase membrane component NrfD
VDPGLLIAQVEHGPQLHGGIVPVILLAIALVGGVAYLIHRNRKGGDRDSGSDRGPEA